MLLRLKEILFLINILKTVLLNKEWDEIELNSLIWLSLRKNMI